MRATQIITPCNPIISVLAGSGKNYSRYGGIMALLSPSQKELYDDLNPMLECNKNRFQQNAAGQPQMTYQYDPMRSVAVAGNALTCAIGQGPVAALSGTYTVNRIKELGSRLTAQEWTAFCCGAEEFFKKEHQGVSFDQRIETKLAGLEVSGVVKRNIGNRIDFDLLQPIENDVITALVAGVGLNPATGSNAPQNINLINAQGQVTENLNIMVQQIQAKMNWCNGKWILLTGTGARVQSYFNRCGISCCNSTQGLDPKAVVAQSASYFEWYRSTSIDSLIGVDGAFLIAPNSATAHFMTNFPEMQGGINSWANTNYGKIYLDGDYCNDQSCVDQPAYAPMEFGVRVRELGCIDGFVRPAMNISLDTQYGIFTKPAGFYYASGPFVNYTGIIRVNFV